MPRAIFRSLAAVLSGGWVPPLLSVECMERDELADFRRENRQRSGAKIPADFGGKLEMSALFFLISLTNYRKAVILPTFPILYSDQSIV